MESPRRFNDCYFYYYSTCTKGDNCVFRHEPAALGCETMCSAWQQGKCLDKRCKLRHMELRKNRKQIPCYWENQPGGCRKMHCPFMHKNPEARTDGIAPSQPTPPQSTVSVGGVTSNGVNANGVVPNSVGVPGVGVPGVVGVVGVPEVAEVPPPPAPLSMIWQQQRQVVLEGGLLGVLPGELLRREHFAAPHPHPHPHPPHPAPHPPHDPLVVNFEDESDNESGPSSTPTKQSPGRGAEHSERAELSEPCEPQAELLLLERIQAEAAAYYSYEPPPPPPPRVAAPHYDRLSLDELSGKRATVAAPERRRSLDFKILSLDEIRARKKEAAASAAPPAAPITLNLSRKRKLSTHETVTTSGNKIIKVVRSNSIVYKKIDTESTPISETKTDRKEKEKTETRKRTLSETINEVYAMQEVELLDDCPEFKRIKPAEQAAKPRLIRNRARSEKDESGTSQNTTEVQIDVVADNTSISSDLDVIDVETTKMAEPIDIVDLSDDDDVIITGSNVPDIVASCQKKVSKEKDILKDIDSILDENNDIIEEL